MKKNLLFVTLLAGTAIAMGAITPNIVKANADTTVTTYLVISSVGTYLGSEEVKDIPELYLENTIEYVAAPNSALPGADKVGTIDDSEGVFASWVCYEGTGAPTQYTKVPTESGKILYAFFNKDTKGQKTLTDLTYEGTLEKTTYDLDAGDSFDPTGITVYAKFDDGSSNDVTSSVSWSSLKPEKTTVTGTYTYKGVSKSITIDGLTVTGTSMSENKIFLDAGGSSLWDQAGAWFAAYCWNGAGNTAYKLEKDGDYYSAEIDTDTFANVIFVRMNPEAGEFTWEKAWNQTNDLTFDGNLYTITGWGSGKSVGTWSTID